MAASACCAIIGGRSELDDTVPAGGEVLPPLVLPGLISGLAVAVLILVMLGRFGIFTAADCFKMADPVSFEPITLDAGAPYSSTAVCGLTVAAALAGPAYVIALAGRPLFGDSILQDG